MKTIDTTSLHQALKLAGKLAIASETVINSKITTVSIAIAILEDALNEYNNYILSLTT